MKHDFLKNAKVTVTATNNTKGSRVAQIVVNDKYEHHFPHKSRISKALDIMTTDQLAEQMTGGNYFFVEESLYDFRDGNYKGFVQNDETIAQLKDLLGINEVEPNDMRVHDNVTSRSFKLGRKWSDNPITIPTFKDGGEFRSELHFGWSPFMSALNSAFKLERLICTNGMRGMRTFMNTKIPLVNRWEEHLNMANTQIQNKVSAICKRRFVQMATERASVGELLNIAHHANERIDMNNVQAAQIQNAMLRNMRNIVNPQQHLDSVYQANVFKRGSPAAMQYPGHLTTMDAFNIVTEIRSHSAPHEKSTTRALDMIANDLVFERKNIILPSSGKVSRKVSAFSDPDAAFFGVMN